ncbi:MAG: TetR/AcrR family transcriptional regulator [Deltaproteobacteria bacterium]
MGQPRRAEQMDMRQRLLGEATRLFAARGFDGTTLQDVADAVGVSKPAVLHHFASKDTLREAVLAALLDPWKETLPRILLAATATDDRFDALLGELRRFFSDAPDRARVVLRELLDRPDAMRRLMRGAVRPWLTAIAGYVRRGQERGRHFADVDAEAYVLHVLQLVLSASASAEVFADALGPGAPRARYDRELVRIARASLFSPKPTRRERRGKTRS